MTKTKWNFSQKTMTKTKSKFAVKINTATEQAKGDSGKHI